MGLPRPLGSLALVVLLLLGGCAFPLPTLRAPIDEDARQSVELLRQRWQGFSDLRTLADIVVDRLGQRTRVMGVLLVQAPDALRFEALSPLGQPLAIVVVHDGHITAYDASTNQATEAPATAETAARLLGLPFEPTDLVAVLSGHAVPPADLRVAERLPPDETGPSLVMVGPNNRQRVWMDFVTGRVQQVEFTGGRSAVLVTYRRDAEGIPAGLDLSGAPVVSGTIRYRDPVIDGGVDPGRFRLALPPGATVHPLR